MPFVGCCWFYTTEYLFDIRTVLYSIVCLLALSPWVVGSKVERFSGFGLKVVCYAQRHETLMDVVDGSGPSSETRLRSDGRTEFRSLIKA